MNSKWSRLALVCMLISVCLLSTSCSDDDDDVTNSNVQSDLFDTWIETSATVNGTAADIAEVLDWEEGTAQGRLILNANYTYQAMELDASNNVLYEESGYFVIDDNWVIVTMNEQNGSSVSEEQTFNGTWILSGTTLTLTQTVGEDTMVLTLIPAT